MMPGRKKHLFLHGGGLFNLAKASRDPANGKLDKFNLEIRRGFLAARRIKVWNSSARGNGGVGTAWSRERRFAVSPKKGCFNPAFWESSVICVCRRSVERRMVLVGELLDVIK